MGLQAQTQHDPRQQLEGGRHVYTAPYDLPRPATPSPAVPTAHDGSVEKPQIVDYLG